MSELTDQMATDIDDTFLTDFGEDGSYLAQGATEAFDARLAAGDGAPSLALASGHLATNSAVDALGSLATLRAGILAKTSVDRDPGLGDTWTCGTGANRGVWQIESARPDVGGGCTLRMHLVREHHSGPAVQQA